MTRVLYPVLRARPKPLTWGRSAVVLVAAIAASLMLWHPARVMVQTLLLLPAMFPAAPIDPLNTIAAAPVHSQHTFTYAGGTVDADLYQPAGVSDASSGRGHGAIVLLLGAGDLPRSDLAVHFADALARVGVVMLISQTSGMLQERLTFDEIDSIRGSIALLHTLPDVDPARVGVVGLSASGGLAIVAAGQPDLRDQISFVNSFGSYADASTLLRDVASRSIQVGDGSIRDWAPEPRTVDVLANTLAAAGVPPATEAQFLAGLPRGDASQAIEALPSGVAERLEQISPESYLTRVRAHIYLMHDLDDSFIPFTQSRDLVARAPTGVIQRYTEFSIFAHVIPDRPVTWQTFVPDVWRLFWHIHAVLLEVL